MELLAPAGSRESLIMAVRCGADAIYMGGTSFNARASAANFNKEQLSEAIDYCHSHNVKAYITLNTLLYDDELMLAYDDACEISSMGADAFIIQDLGLLSLLKENTDIELHASTQMSLHNVDGVKTAVELGCKRVVLARETPIEDIKKIKERTDTEIEVFVHGALCIGFSGQCLFSSLVGGRSGNRGKCAQACRLPYELLNDSKECASGYLLSPKDLCTVSYINKLLDVGVDSLKIEGRLKRPEYVGVVTKQYREVLDLLSSDKDVEPTRYINELAAIFNRGGFTKGYYLGANDIIFSQSPNNTGIKVGRVLSADGKHIFADKRICKGDGVEIRRNSQGIGGGAVYDIIKDGNKVNSAEGKAVINSLAPSCKDAEIYRTTDKAQIDSINSYAAKEVPRIGLKVFFEQTENSLCLTVDDSRYKVAVEREYDFVQGGTREGDVISSLSKFGGTQYYVKNASVSVIQGGYIPQGIINSMRREAKEKLDLSKILSQKNRTAYKALEDVAHRADSILHHEPLRSIFAYDPCQLKVLCSDKRYSRVYYKPTDYNIPVKLPEDRVNQVYFVPFDISFEEDMSLYDIAEKFDGIYAENLFCIQLARRLNKKCIAGLGLNVLNCESAILLHEMGCEAVTISCEATAKQIDAISQVCDSEVVARGRLPMMKLAFCPARGQGLCTACNGKFELKDRLGNLFELSRFKTRKCRNIILNSVNIDLEAEMQKKGISVCDLNNGILGSKVTKGHYNRGV